MLDRASTFSDPQVIERLQRDFVPAVGNTHELQNQKLAASSWFMEMASLINPRVKSGVTAQGFYVCAADGTGYAFLNHRGPERVLAAMSSSLKAFQSRPPAQVCIKPEEAQAAFCRLPKEMPSTLRVYSRILPLPQGVDELNKGIGRDHLWIYPEEVAQMHHRGEFAMPASLARRLVRFHLVDEIRGEPEFWKPEEVRSLKSRMWSLGGNRVAFQLTYAMQTADSKRGLTGTLEGNLTLDANTKAVRRLRAYGEAKAWGAGPYTPRPPEGQFPIRFAIVDVHDDVSRSTPPQAAAYGDEEYRNPK